MMCACVCVLLLFFHFLKVLHFSKTSTYICDNLFARSQATDFSPSPKIFFPKGLHLEIIMIQFRMVNVVEDGELLHFYIFTIVHYT